MKILGISAFYHDSAATLINNGEIISAVQEERFTRKKHDSSFPIHSIKYCLEQTALNKHSDDASLTTHTASSYSTLLKNIDYIAYYDKPFLTFERLLENYLKYAPFQGFSSFQKAMPLWLGGKLNLRSHIKKILRKHLSISKKDIPEILFNYHHLSHAASAFYPSPFEESAILCLDGVGEWATTSAWVGKNSSIEPLWQIDFPHSLGLLYSTFTEYCGFKVNSGEYKLMGLAPYGEPCYASLLKDHVIHIKPDGSFILNEEYFSYMTSLKMSHPNLYKLLGRGPRKPETKIDIHYMNVASSVQKVLEEVILKLAHTLYKQTKMPNLCMAGGVALNCVANNKIFNNSPFSSLWIQPAAGDAGGSLGAAYSVWHQHLEKPRFQHAHSKIKLQMDSNKVGADATTRSQTDSAKIGSDAMKGAQLGIQYSNKEIEILLNKKGADYKKLKENEMIQTVTKELAQGMVVGWFHGAMEFGPRALGCRSILADPRAKDMQNKLNQKIKKRESFRPFAISILEERVSDYFENIYSPYMLLTSFILPNKRKDKEINKKGLEKLSVFRSDIQACTHVDCSTRIQTVGKEALPLYRKLLENFYQQTSCPGIINTSFNVRGEPIVCSPEDAYQCFLNTDMDSLSIGSYYLKKIK